MSENAQDCQMPRAAPMMEGLCPYRSTVERSEGGKRRFEMFMTPPGADEIKMFSYVYSRAG